MTKMYRQMFTVFFGLFVLALAGCASDGKREGTGAYVDDAVITTKVKAALFNEPTLKASEVNVETYKGVVQLSGFIAHREDAPTASRIAGGVKGVVSVKNDLRLK